MSSTTIAPASHDDGFGDFEFRLIVADFDTPEPRRTRPSRQVQEAEAIRESLGEYRHRTHERREN